MTYTDDDIYNKIFQVISGPHSIAVKGKPKSVYVPYTGDDRIECTL